MNTLKTVSLVLLFALFSPIFSITHTYAEEQTYFIVTAYYSPLPDQEYYLTGNYQDEIRLNGRGIAGASGEEVFSGMLAAPKSYAFGTNIYLEGLGVGRVEDRGGAIVPAGQRGYSYDRIDVWMGYGDEGLRRALYWGKRKVAGYITSENTNLDYSVVPAPLWASEKLTKQTPTASRTIATEVTQASLFTQSLGKNSSGEYVKELQKILESLGFIQEYTPGRYDQATIDAVYNLQIETEILESSSDYGAGYFGPKTRKELKIIYEEYLLEQEKEAQRLAKIEELENLSSQQAEEILTEIQGVRYGEISPRVRRFQQLLSKLGYFKHKDTAIFGEVTINAIIELQLEHNIISHNQDAGAGVFGPQTQKVTLEILQESIIAEMLQQEGIEI